MFARQKSFYIVKLLLDLLIINLFFFVAAITAQSLGILLERQYMFILLPVLILVWYYTSTVSGFYEDFNRSLLSSLIIRLGQNILWQSAVAVIFIFLVKEDLFTRNFIIFYAGGIFVAVSVRMLVLKQIVKNRSRSDRQGRKLLVIGSGEIAGEFAEMIRKTPEFDFSVAGFVTVDDKEPDILGDHLGKVEDLEAIINQNGIEEAVIAVEGYNQSVIDHIMDVCNKTAVKVHIIPDYFKFLSKRFQVGMIGSFPIITMRKEPLEEIHWAFLKRAFDIIFAAIVLITVGSWLFPIIILIIRVTSPGKAMFIQDRVGQYDRIFKCYKFRTMKPGNFDKTYQAVVKDDGRVTAIGRILRKTNLDELPQIINVLKGEMSIVGPRPHAVKFNETYAEFFDYIKLRHRVKPGITGWAQVNGYRGDAKDESENRQWISNRIRHDIWYMENWSFLLDIQIIILTVWKMATGQGRGHHH